MRIPLSWIAVTLIMLFGKGWLVAQPASPFYGFYYTAWPNVGGFATNVNGFANVGDLIWNKAAADQIIACNSKLIINCTPVFYIYGTPGLNPNYQSAWNALKAQLTPHYLSQVAAFYVMDEPYYNGFTRAQLETAVATVKADFPTIPAAVTFAYTSLPNFTNSSWIPAGLDWISPDQYGNFNAIPGLIATLKTHKQPHQKIFLTTQGFRQNSVDADATVADWSYDYHDLYLSEPEILGQLVFLCRGSRELAFPADGTMPLTYAVQQSIGTEVLKMGNSFKRAFSDLFESAPAWTSNWSSAGAWTRSTIRKRPGGSYTAHLAGPVTDSALTATPISVAGATKASVNLWWFISGLDSGEYVRCDVKLDDGPWIQKASIDGGGTSGSRWLRVTVSDIDVSGATSLHLRFRGTMNLASENASVDSVNVCLWADPVVTSWPTATGIGFGQPLSASTLSGGVATPAGRFEWTAPYLVAGAGTTTQSVTFIPDDITNFNRLRGSASVTMAKGNPTVTSLPNATQITYGQTLASSFLFGGAGMPAGSFSWTVPATAPGAGTAPQSVTFTPNDTTNYNAIATNINVTVRKANPVVSPWPTATVISYGSSLGDSALVGGSVTPTGIFTWALPAFVPDAGTNLQNVVFTPADTNNYNRFTNAVSLTVNRASSVTRVESSLNPSVEGDNVEFMATVSSAGGIPGGEVEFQSNGVLFATAFLTNGAASVNLANLPSGTNVIAVSYAAQSNWLSSSGNLQQVVNRPDSQTNNWSRLIAGNASGSWPVGANWSAGEMPSSFDTVDFSTLDITADSSVTLDGNQSANGLVFGDAVVSTAAGWILSAGANNDSVLMLMGANPTIKVHPLGGEKTVVIAAPLDGSGGVVIVGGGTLVLAATNGYSGATLIGAGMLEVSGSISNHSPIIVSNTAALKLQGGAITAGLIHVQTNASLSGCGKIHGALINDGTVISECGAGFALQLDGPVTNNGTMLVTAGTKLDASGPFVNNGLLDLINAVGILPSGFVNNGVVLDSTSVQVSKIQVSDQDVLVQIQSAVGHNYRLQRTDALNLGNWHTVGASQAGTGGLLTFTNSSVGAQLQGFYRFQVD